MLGLENTRVSDAGLVRLTGLTNSRWLDLSGTSVSDAGLVHLRGLKDLGRLDLRETQVTAAGVNELQQALPEADIGWNDPAAPQE